LRDRRKVPNFIADSGETVLSRHARRAFSKHAFTIDNAIGREPMPKPGGIIREYLPNPE
jgi:hypothetical protein